MQGQIGEFGHLSRLAHAPGQPSVRLVRRAPARGAPLVGIVRNPRSHRNKGHEPELADCANILVETPRSHEALQATLRRFAERGIDYLAVDGGDGTVRDVLTCGAGVFGDAWPTLVVLPKGKTNALAVDLGLPNVWTLPEAMEAIGRGRTIVRRPLAIESRDTAGAIQGFILGAGAGFTLATQAGQQAHRWGAFNSFAVALSILWGLLQTMFGGNRNRWRRGTPMAITADGGVPVARSGHGSAAERFVIFASTLERFPLGIRPFGTPRAGLKLALIDAPLRGVLALLPAVMTGWNPRFLARLGLHRVDADALDVELGDRFILDGEYFPAGRYRLRQGPEVRFVAP